MRFLLPVLQRLMASLRRRRLLPLLALLAAGASQANVFEDGGLLMVQVAPGVIHYSHDPDHADYSWLVGLEWQSASRWHAGFLRFADRGNQDNRY